MMFTIGIRATDVWYIDVQNSKQFTGLNGLLTYCIFGTLPISY